MLQIIFSLYFLHFASSEYVLADYNYNPKKIYTTLYIAGQDPVVQLDSATFNNTVYCENSNCSDVAYLVQVRVPGP